MLTLEQQQIIKLALEEDLSPYGDLSSELLLAPSTQARAQIIAKEAGVMACSWIIQAVLEEYLALEHIITRSAEILTSLRSPGQATQSTSKVNLYFQDGQTFQAGDLIAEINGPAQMILTTERTILNFLQRLTGIATYTRKLVDLIKDYPCKLLDTRKTMPGMRLLEKEAFKCGGGTNHRLNLSDMVMLKENHIALAGLDLVNSINQVRQKLDAHVFARSATTKQSKQIKIEVEINKENLNKLEAVISAGVDQIMLDNFSAEEAKNIIKQIRSLNKTTKIELSGGINETNLQAYANTGADYVSTSAAFTKANNIDLSMIIV